MSPPQNARAALHARRALPNTKSSKPAPLTTKKGYTGAPSKKSPTSKLSPGWSKSSSKREAVVDSEEDDMSGLPQFCTTCEKQIITPRNSMLYCSESCRKKDHNKPLQEALLHPELSPQLSSRRTSFLGDEIMMDGSTMRSPTAVRRSSSIAFSDSSEASSYYDRNESEAAHYLSQFRRSDPSIEYKIQPASYEHNRFSTSNSTAPSLSHTPTSVVSTSGSYRPLPRRGDPFSASFSSFSVDLITPVLNTESLAVPLSPHYRSPSVGSVDSTGTAFHTANREMTYEKKLLSPDDSMASGSLKQLFSHDAMQAPPKLQAPLSVNEDDISDRKDFVTRAAKS